MGSTALLGLLVLVGVVVDGCTNILVSKGASADGSTQIAYNADSGSLFGSLSHYPAGTHAAGTQRAVWDWDDSVFLGSIPEANETFNVVGNMNEHGLIIGETTFGGLPQLDGHGHDHVMDYGSLIWITLQRARTAREAIRLIDALCTAHGYASDGESFSLADQNEVWLMELIGKGAQKGAVWVARRVPEGYVGSTANQARIRTFPRDDPENCMYAADCVSFAVQQGLYPAHAADETFSFSDVYDPVTFTGARLAEARVWNLFRVIAGPALLDRHLDYATGRNLTNRMPLFVPAQAPLTVNDTMWLMRTHFEGTWFDNTGAERSDVGAGSGSSPYRWRPLKWTVGDRSYVNERTVGVQQTAWTFVAQSRGWLPAHIGSVIWWAPDDSATAVRVPFYASITRLPAAFADPVGQEPAAAAANGVQADAYTMSLDSAFWIWNLVANMAYGERYSDVYPEIQSEIVEIETDLHAQVAVMDGQAVAASDHEHAVALLTAFCERAGADTLQKWRAHWMYLFARYRDGFTVDAPKLEQCKGTQTADCTSRVVPDVQEGGYSDSWYARIVAENGDHYAVPPSHQEHDRRMNEHKLLRMDKRRRR